MTHTCDVWTLPFADWTDEELARENTKNNYDEGVPNEIYRRQYVAERKLEDPSFVMRSYAATEVTDTQGNILSDPKVHLGLPLRMWTSKQLNSTSMKHNQGIWRESARREKALEEVGTKIFQALPRNLDDVGADKE
jgi:hypothetical protein